MNQSMNFMKGAIKMNSIPNKLKKKIERCVLCGPKLKNDNIAHFNFPKTKFADDWKSFCAKVNPIKIIFSSSKLCCIHFTEESFSSITDRHTLKKDAIPSLIPNYSESVPRTCSHNLTEVTRPKIKKREYGLHKYSTHCLLCKLRKTGIASFHFPKNEDIRRQWIEFCQVDSTRINVTSTLCQYHFTEDSFQVSKCGRVRLKSGTIPSIRVVDPPNCRRKKKMISPDVPVEEIVVDVDWIIPPERPNCSETRRNEPTNSSASTSWEEDNVSDMIDISTTTSPSAMLQLTSCFFCKTTSADFVQYRFPNNTAMRLELTAKCGISPLCLDEINTVCVSHFDDDDIYVDNNGKKMIKDRAFPWCYYSQITAKSSNNISPSPTAGAGSVEPASFADANETAVTPVRLSRRKSYVGDMTPTDFRTPRRARRNLMFIKDKFKATAVKVKKLQDENRYANHRVQKVLEKIRTLKEEGLVTNNVATTEHEFAENYVCLMQTYEYS